MRQSRLDQHPVYLRIKRLDDPIRDFAFNGESRRAVNADLIAAAIGKRNGPWGVDARLRWLLPRIVVARKGKRAHPIAAHLFIILLVDEFDGKISLVDVSMGAGVIRFGVRRGNRHTVQIYGARPDVVAVPNIPIICDELSSSNSIGRVAVEDRITAGSDKRHAAGGETLQRIDSRSAFITAIGTAFEQACADRRSIPCDGKATRVACFGIGTELSCERHIDRRRRA